MKRAKGANVGTTTRMTEKEARKFNTPDRHCRAEFCKAPSTVLMSVVKRFRILPIGVTSKKRAGARVSLRRSEINSERDACRLA